MSLGPPATADCLHLEDIESRLRSPRDPLTLLHCCPASGCQPGELLASLHALLCELSISPAPPVFSAPAEVQLYPLNLQKRLLELLQQHRSELRRRPPASRLWLSALTGATAALVSGLVNLVTPGEDTIDLKLAVLAVLCAVGFAIALEYGAFYLLSRQTHARLRRDIAGLLSAPGCRFVLLDSSRRDAMQLDAPTDASLFEQITRCLGAVRRPAEAPRLVMLLCHSAEDHAQAELLSFRREQPGLRLSADVCCLRPCFSGPEHAVPEQAAAVLPEPADGGAACRHIYSQSQFISSKLQSLAEALRLQPAQPALALAQLSQHDSLFLERLHSFLRSGDPGELDEMGLGADFRQQIEDRIFDLLARRALQDRDNIYYLANVSHPTGYSRGYRLEDPDWVAYQLKLLGQLAAGASRDNLLPISLFALTLFFEAVWWYGEWHLNEALVAENNSGIAIGPAILRHLESACRQAGLPLEGPDGPEGAPEQFFRQSHRLLRAFVGLGPLVADGGLPLSKSDINFDYGWGAVLPVIEDLLGRLEDESSYAALRRAYWTRSRAGGESAANLRLRSLLHDKLGDGYEALMVQAQRNSDSARAAEMARLSLDEYGWTRALYAFEREQQLERYSNSCPFAYYAWSWYESAELLFRLSTPRGEVNADGFSAPPMRLARQREMLASALVELQHYYSCSSSFQDFEWELMAGIQLQLAELYSGSDTAEAAQHYCNALLACQLLHFTETDVDGYSSHVQGECAARLQHFLVGRSAAGDQAALARISDFWQRVALAVQSVQDEHAVSLMRFDTFPAPLPGAEMLLPAPATAASSGSRSRVAQASASLVRLLHRQLFEMLSLRPLENLRPAGYTQLDSANLENPS